MLGLLDKMVLRKVMFLLLLSAGLVSIHAQKPVPLQVKDTLVTNAAQHRNMLIYFKSVKVYQDSSLVYDYDPNLFLSYAKSGLAWANEHGSSMDILESKFYALRYSFDVGNYNQGLKYANDLLDSELFQEDKRVIKVTSYVKRMYLNLASYNELLDFFPTYDRLNRKHGRVISKSDYINDLYLAGAYYRQKNFEKAILYYKRSTNKALQQEDWFRASSLYNDIGLCFKNLDLWDSANSYFDKALKLTELSLLNATPSKLEGLDFFRLVIESNKADYYIEKGEHNKALPIYLRELKASKGSKNLKILESAYYNIALVHYLNEKYNLAQRHLDSIFNIATDQSSYLEKALELRAKCYALTGNSKLANKYFTQVKRLKDSMELSRIRNNYIVSTTQYELARKESDLLRSQERISAEKRQNNLTLIGLCAISFLALLLFLFYKRAKNDKKRLAEQKKIVEKEVQEKSLLLKEVHHRVKNNLQVVSGLLDLQGTKKSKVEFDVLVEDTKKYIHSMSLVHEMLYKKDHYMRVNIQEYLTQLTYFTASSQVKKNVKITVDALNIKLPLDKATPLGLIITELVSNSYKHAFSEEDGTIAIKLVEHNKGFELSYNDNGIGLDDNFSISTNKSLGFKLIHMFAEEMNGLLEINKANKKGFSLNLIFN